MEDDVRRPRTRTAYDYDPLDDYRAVIGPERAARIDAIAREAEAQVSARDSASLRAELQEQIDPFRQIRRAGASATLANERDSDFNDARTAQAGRRIAVVRELRERRVHEVDEAVTRAIENPPQDLLEQIGPPPDRSAPERHEWEALTKALTRTRFAVQGDPLLGLQPARFLVAGERALAERVKKMRELRGLAAAPPDRAREQAPEVEAGGMEM